MEKININEIYRQEQAGEWEIKKGIVNSYLDFISQDELDKQLLFCYGSKKEREKLIKVNNLNEDVSDEELLIFFRNKIEVYKKYVDEVKESLPAIKKLLSEWAEVNNINYLQNFDDVPVFITENTIKNIAKDRLAIRQDLPSFNPNKNTVTTLPENNVLVLVHEYLHAFSFNGLNKIGFICVDDEFEYDHENYNQWLNEGCTIYIEQEIIGDKLGSENSSNFYINNYLWLTKLFIDELGIDKNTLFKAYFGDKNCNELLNGTCMSRFKCNIYDLKRLLIGTTDVHKDKIKMMLKGEDVELNNYPGFDTGLIKIFPNIKLKNL